MVAVAVVGLLFGIDAWVWRQSRAFQARADRHTTRLALPMDAAAIHPYDYDDYMRNKYERAARYPRLPVKPDPPEPA